MPRNVLVLGAGMIAAPLVRYLLTRTDHQVVVAARQRRKASALVEDFARGAAVGLDMNDAAALDALVSQANVVVSLLPAGFNPKLAEVVLRHRVPLVNTSYVAAEMRALDEKARLEGVLLLNEIGLDPGLDHMSAMRLARQVRHLGGTVTEFSSCCGGFPAPEDNNNLWGYKFSWFPRGMLMAGRNPARYLRQGTTVEVPGPELFASSWPYAIDELGALEIYPNRDALVYQVPYEMADTRGFFRGTIRYPGWCALMKAAVDLGLFDVATRDWPAGTTYADVADHRLPAGSGPLSERIGEQLGIDADADIVARLEWAGLLSDRLIATAAASPLDVLAGRLQKMLVYRPGERDAVALEHKLTATFPDGQRERIVSRLVALGKPWGETAMASTVALPAAIATRLILEGRIGAVGVQIPVMPEIYRPVLQEMEELGFAFKEERLTDAPGPLS